MSSLEELLGNARQLRAKIVQQDSELTVRRNLQQIQSQVRERAANVQGLDGPAEPDAQTFRFLAKQGIDAKALDPMAIDLIPGGPGGGGGGAADDVFGSEDLESFLQREEQRILVDAVERNKQMTIAEFSRSYWGKLEADWQAQKPMVVEALRFHSAPQPTGGGAVVVAAAAAETSLHAQGRSRVRGARALAYSHAIRDLWDKRVARQTDFNLMRRMAEAAQTSAGSAAVKLHSCWELLEAMVRELQKLRPSGTDPAVEAPYQQRDGPQGLPLRCALLRGALSHLGAQMFADMDRRIKAAPQEASLGGQLGTEHYAAAYVRLLKTPAEQERDKWSAVFWCVRCGDMAAAARAARQLAGGGPGGADALLRLLQKMASMQAGEPAAAAPTLAAAVRAAQDEYWQQKQALEGSAHRMEQLMLYSVLAAPEPRAKMGDLMPSGERPSIEDWLWHKLSMVLVQLEGGVDVVAPTSPSHPLVELQRLLGEQYGEAYFNKGGNSPLLFFSVLLHSQQFERAVGFLAREERGRPNAALADMGEEALHFALALLHEGLLACAAHGEGAADGAPLDGYGRLLLPSLLKQHVMAWGGEDRVSALRYVWMLRGDEAVRQHLALDVLQHCGGDGAVLSQSLPFLELQPPSKRKLMVELAERLHASGLPLQAMTLLYQVGTAQAAGGLVANADDDERACREALSRLCEMLLEAISKQLIEAHAAAGTARVADAAARLRTDARRFLQQWEASDLDEGGLLTKGGLLRIMLEVGELLGAVDSWQQQRRDEQGEAALALALEKISDERLPLAYVLPAEPVQVDQKQAVFRQLGASAGDRALQRTFPALLEASMSSVHAKYTSLKLPRAAAAGGGNVAETMMQLRRRGEALVAMAGVSSWAAAEVLGQLQMPAAINQRLVSWLAEMA